MVVQDFIAFVGIYGGFGQRHFRDMFQLNPLILSRGSHFSNSKKLQKLHKLHKLHFQFKMKRIFATTPSRATVSEIQILIGCQT